MNKQRKKEMKLRAKERKRALKGKPPKKKQNQSIKVFALIALLMMLIPVGLATFSAMNSYLNPQIQVVESESADASTKTDSILKLNEDGTHQETPAMESVETTE